MITTVTFPAGITEQFVSVSTTDDDNSEGLESFTATLSNASPNVVTINQSLATVSIEDNDGEQLLVGYNINGTHAATPCMHVNVIDFI